ncbi:hypothetical protein JAAARDRAFT_124082 [Jaapia argillacea MUCL 33604]|uniref:Transcription activator of gluconeogenesis ERT1 n=1 Tax=Jaapia argillacea MUCL 33604 TaxID=933084 RepID=A0A067Q0S9_9AGAM|nr:hypothetical protein JAAARDRAFT_124082 [Jaapia argillacea MUCL 33604]
MAMHPIAYPGMPMHMYPFSSGLIQSPPLRTKRRQVKNACTNCQKACKKCDDARPCLRCVKYGIAEECVDSQRKERKKGIKRGPYKKRDGKNNNNVEQADDTVQQPGITMPGAVAPAAASPPPMPYVAPMGYPPGIYSQYPPAPPKPGEPAFYPQFYLTPVPSLPHGTGQDGDGGGYPPHTQFYPATFLAPYGQPYAPYIVPHRLDGQMQMSGPQYGAYPPMYTKQMSLGSPGGEGGGREGRMEAHKGGDGGDGRSG